VKRVKCFAEEAARLGNYTTLEAGPRVIELRRVIGTVNKCGQLDRDFRLIGRRRDRRERFRRLQLDNVALHLTSLPPIDVYLLAGEYYVIDGNRRVAAAKRQGLEYLDAHVVECLPLADREELQGAVTRRRFEQETGLKSLALSFERGYTTLLHEVAEYAPAEGEVAVQDRARAWYSKVFLPASELIRRSPLPAAFPRGREADLYVMICRFYRDLMGGPPQGVSFESLLSGFLFARGIRSRRPLRRPAMRLLYRFFSLTAPRPDS
jgi:uncharacterized ParB-like nuclease family protein